MALDAVTKNGMLGNTLGVPPTKGGARVKKRSVTVATPPKPKNRGVKGTGSKGTSSQSGVK